jgi:hypothetical protein
MTSSLLALTSVAGLLVGSSLQVGLVCSPAPPRSSLTVCLQGTSRRATLDDDDDDDSFTDDDVENLFFLFDESGAAKPWAIKPHLQAMVQEVKAGDAMLLDCRPEASWQAGHLQLATSCPLDEMAGRLEASPWDSELTLCVPLISEPLACVRRRACALRSFVSLGGPG